jgi:hypothetical protein
MATWWKSASQQAPDRGMTGRSAANNRLPRFRRALSRISWRTCVADQSSDHNLADLCDVPLDSLHGLSAGQSNSSGLTCVTRPLATWATGISGTWRRTGDAVRHRRRAEDEPVERPSGRSRHASARHRNADGWHAVATWAGRDICICRRSAGHRQCTCHDQACEYLMRRNRHLRPPTLGGACMPLSSQSLSLKT